MVYDEASFSAAFKYFCDNPYLVAKKYQTDHKGYIVSQLRMMTEAEVYAFIRKRLSFREHHLLWQEYMDREHPEGLDSEGRRLGLHFEMSGYDTPEVTNTVYNQQLLAVFADLGIYSYWKLTALLFWKGAGTLYLKQYSRDPLHEECMGGLTTTDIIYAVFKATVLSNMDIRRRN